MQAYLFPYLLQFTACSSLRAGLCSKMNLMVRIGVVAAAFVTSALVSSADAEWIANGRCKDNHRLETANSPAEIAMKMNKLTSCYREVIDYLKTNRLIENVQPKARPQPVRSTGFSSEYVFGSSGEKSGAMSFHGYAPPR